MCKHEKECEQIGNVLRDDKCNGICDRPSAASAGYGEPKTWLIRIAAELAIGDFLPSDLVDDYPQSRYSAAKVAKMMKQPREQARTMAYNLRQIADLMS